MAGVYMGYFKPHLLKDLREKMVFGPMRVIQTFLWCTVAIFSIRAFSAEGAVDPFAIFDKTTALVSKNFYDQTFHGQNWPALVRDARIKLKKNPTEKNLEIVLNQLLKKLHASHTEFLSSSDQEYWALEFGEYT